MDTPNRFLLSHRLIFLQRVFDLDFLEDKQRHSIQTHPVYPIKFPEQKQKTRETFEKLLRENILVLSDSVPTFILRKCLRKKKVSAVSVEAG